MLGYNNANLTKIYDNADFPLGAEVQYGDKKYQFVKYNAGDEPQVGVAGYVAIGLDSAYSPHEVTCDWNSSTINAVLERPKGILMAALTDGKYGWIQKTGLNDVAMLSPEEDIAQDEELMVHATTNGGVDKHTGDPIIIGVALENDSGTALAIGTVELKM